MGKTQCAHPYGEGHPRFARHMVLEMYVSNTVQGITLEEVQARPFYLIRHLEDGISFT